MINSIKIKDILVNFYMSDDLLLKFLNLPLNTKIFYYNPSTFQSLNNENEMFVYKYIDSLDRKIIRVGVYNNSYFNMHNLFGYARICFSGKSIFFSRFINDCQTCFTEPAYVKYTNGKLVKKEYRINGFLHNIQGPALSYIYDNKWYNEFYYMGKLISLKKFCDIYEKRLNKI